MRWQGRVVVITGGSSGIGRSLGVQLGQAGAKVVLADIQAERLAATCQALQQDGLAVEGIVTDVSDESAVEALAEAVYARHGAVHLLFNNAGVGLKEAKRPIWTLPAVDWQWGVSVNVFGVVNGIRAFVPRMMAGGQEGVIVNTSSANGGLFSLPTTPIYAATKAAVTSLSEVLQQQLVREGSALRCAVLFPGPGLVNTDILNSARSRPAAFGGPGEAGYVDMARLAAAAGVALELTEPDAVARFALEGIRAGRFWLLPDSERNRQRLRARVADILGE